MKQSTGRNHPFAALLAWQDKGFDPSTVPREFGPGMFLVGPLDPRCLVGSEMGCNLYPFRSFENPKPGTHFAVSRVHVGTSMIA